MADAQTGIAIKSRPFLGFLGFMLYIFPVTVKIDGVAHAVNWNEHFFAVAPGTHRVEVTWKYFWFLDVNRADMMVQVNPGQVTRLRYKSAFLVFMRGTLAPAPAAA